MKRLLNFLPILLLLFVVACDEDVVRGSGPVVTRALDLPTLRGVDVGGSQEVVITQGDIQEVTVEGQANLINILSTPRRRTGCGISISPKRYGKRVTSPST